MPDWCPAIGGTGASPQSSIKYAGLPWEMGLSETHQVLQLNRLRHRVRLRTDGGIKTGRDVVIAAMLGAEEFGIRTASLVAMGCIMVRQCHSNTCPVGVCVQDEALRQKFTGTPEKVINLFSFVAEEVREIIAALGFRKLTDVIGRTDLLQQVSRGSEDLDDLDLNPLLVQADAGPHAAYCTLEGRNEVPGDVAHAEMIQDAEALFRHGEKMHLEYNIRNTHRAIGTKVSSRITRQFGMSGLQPGHLNVRLRGVRRPVARRLRRAGAQARSLRRCQRLCWQGAFGGVHRGAPVHRPRRWCGTRTPSSATPAGRCDGRAVRRRPGGRTLRGRQFRRHRGSRRLRCQWLRVHDRRHRRHPRRGRR